MKRKVHVHRDDSSCDVDRNAGIGLEIATGIGLEIVTDIGLENVTGIGPIVYRGYFCAFACPSPFCFDPRFPAYRSSSLLVQGLRLSLHLHSGWGLRFPAHH